MIHRERTRRTATVLGLVGALGMVAACGDSGGSTAAGGDSLTLRLGHAGAVDSIQNQIAESLAEDVAELTDGEMTIEVYPSSQLGSWEEMQEGLEIGSVDILIESLGSLERYTPLAAAASVPLLYEDEEHFVETWDGELGGEILEAVAGETGFRIMGMLYRGPFVTATNRPVESPSDLAGLKLRVPNQETVVETWRALGASPTPLPLNEVFSALEQNAIDGVENPIDIHRYNSFYEMAPYIAETNHLYGNYHFHLWDENYQSWPEHLRAAFDEAVDNASAEYRELSTSDAVESKELLVSEGVTFTEVDRDEWREAAEPALGAFTDDVREWADQVRALRE